MTTQLTTLNRIISEIKELNEFDGETVEFILKEIGYEDYMLRHLIMSEPMESINDALEERIEFDRDNTKTEVNPDEQGSSAEWEEIKKYQIESKRLAELVWNEYSRYTRKKFLLIYDVTAIPLILVAHEVWNDIENRDTLMFNKFEDYWTFFIANKK